MTLIKNKVDWLPIRLGDVVEKREENDRENANTRFDNFVRGEDLDPESLHLKRMGSQGNEELPPSFYKIFRKGQILFMTRRPYLRKNALAHCDGICGEKMLTLQVKEEIADARLIPFLFHSAGFYEHTTGCMIGSTNPHCRWRDVANYEFLLPPKEQQVKLAELLWAADAVVESSRALCSNARNALSSSLNWRMIHGFYKDDRELMLTKCGLLDPRIEVAQLRDCLSEKPSYGANASARPYESNAPRYIRITDIDDEGNLIEKDPVSIELEDWSEYILKEDDFLFARTGNTVGKTLLYKSDFGPAVYAGYLIRFRLNQNKLRPKFLHYFTKSLKYDSFKRAMIKVGAQPNINSEEYQSMHIPDFDISTQDGIVAELQALEARVKAADSQASAARNLLKSLINQIF